MESLKQRRSIGQAWPLLLASASPRRADILRTAGLEFEVRPSEIDEPGPGKDQTPVDLAIQLAGSKAKAVARLHRKSAVIGADTVVILDGEALGKPRDEDDARAMLVRLRERSHDVVTGVAVIRDGNERSGFRRTAVRMRAYSDPEIDAYVRSGAPLDKAGAYGIQDRRFAPVGAIDGCRLNVVGLPLCLLGELMRGRAGEPHTPWIDCPGCPEQRTATIR